jgi:hypothetical protein
VDAFSLGVGAHGGLGLLLAKEALGVLVSGVTGPDVVLQLGVRMALPGGLLDPWPQSTRSDRLGLARVADLDQPRAGLLDRR